MDVVDVVTLGESMVTFLPSRPGRLADVPSFDRGIGGAESNVACGLAAAGHSVKWVSRVGADGFGRHLVERIAAHGVDTSAVLTDPSRPTGIYFRTAGERALTADAGPARGVGGAKGSRGADGVRGSGNLREPDAAGASNRAGVSDTAGISDSGAEGDLPAEVVYYRTGSAASAMSPANMPGEEIRSGRVLHLSGITAALSDDCLALLRELTAPRPGRPLVSFDVNYRVDLWHDRAEAAGLLLDLARGSDLVFVGADEAEAAWGVTGGPEAIRATLPEPRLLVVKEGGRGVTVFEREPHDDVSEEGGRGATVFQRESREDASGEAGAVRRPEGGPAGWFHGNESYGDASGEAGAVRRPGAGPAVDKARAAGGSPAAGRLHGPDSVTHGPDSVTHVPALRVDVVAHVGAGDAFAAGFLSATLRGLPVRDRIRHGHLMAAAVLTVPGDLGEPPAREYADRLVALDDDEWGRLRLGPGWTQADRAEEEVRTP
ncbi:sugar kinase [Streptomyces sp. CA-288835]|uniref:sugar kinase n=1 Tax=Streptomyces sp. CA-288835 TaxID=3240069 RepID=UPI003D8C0C33